MHESLRESSRIRVMISRTHEHCRVDPSLSRMDQVVLRARKKFLEKCEKFLVKMMKSKRQKKNAGLVRLRNRFYIPCTNENQIKNNFLIERIKI